MPTQRVMCETLGIGTPKTFRTHRDYLIEHGYVVEEKDKYVLPNKEDMFLMIPLKTLQFLNDVLKEQVIKVYVYLGQRWKYKEGYVFTYNELVRHTGGSGANDARQNRVVANALACLQKLGLIDYVEFNEWNSDIQKSVPKKRFAPIIAQVLAIFPVFCGISGSTITICIFIFLTYLII